MRAATDHIANPDLVTTPLPVHPHLRGAPHHAQADVLTWSEDDGTHRERKRAHRHEDEVLQGWLQDRAAARQRIRGGPAGGRHDGPVRVDHSHPLPTHVDLEAQDASLTRMVDHDLVETDLLRQGPAFSRQRHMQHRPFLDPVGTVEKSAQAGAHLIRFDLCQEAEMAMVDAQDRDVPGSRHPRAGQKSSIAAQREDEVGLLQQLRHRVRLRVPLELDGVDLPRLHGLKHAVDLVLLHA